MLGLHGLKFDMIVIVKRVQLSIPEIPTVELS